MASTDNPLKQLVESCITDFATWLLDSAVLDAQPLNVELLAQTVRVDQLYRVTLVDGRVIKLHIEFQGIRTHEPMPLRMLDYMTRLVKLDPALDLHSVVFYVGAGAGADDKGIHAVNGPDSKPVIQWRYHIIQLWKMKAEELLALHQPALLPLVGQTKIDNPELILPQVVDELKTVSDEMLRKRLLTGLLALMNDKGAAQMIETMLEKEELLTDTPFLQKIREEARTKALADGLAAGKAEGINEGARSSARRDILNVLKWRFDPSISRYEQIQQVLNTIHALERLETLLKLAVQATDLDGFQKGLQAVVSQSSNQQANGDKQ